MIETIMEWLRHEPTSLDDWLELTAVALMGGIAMAGIAFAHGGSNPAAVMYERSLTVSEDGQMGRAWKLTLFVLGETIFYQGILMTATVYYSADDLNVIASAVAVAIAQGFLPPHHHLPMQTRIAACLGGFILSLIFLKCGGWQNTWPLIHARAFIATWLAHLVPVTVLSAVFAYNHRNRESTTTTPRPP
ncbi:hypothetical protein HYW59_00330 [Candidatus Kaiserbacteria bacterium]|nr:hypothetical protein [Candidatus Kaiserbacteria bacterium]